MFWRQAEDQNTCFNTNTADDNSANKPVKHLKGKRGVLWEGLSSETPTLLSVRWWRRSWVTAELRDMMEKKALNLGLGGVKMLALWVESAYLWIKRASAQLFCTESLCWLRASLPGHTLGDCLHFTWVVPGILNGSLGRMSFTYSSLPSPTWQPAHHTGPKWPQFQCIYIKAEEITYSLVWSQHSSLSASIYASYAPSTSHFPANSRLAVW